MAALLRIHLPHLINHSRVIIETLVRAMLCHSEIKGNFRVSKYTKYTDNLLLLKYHKGQKSGMHTLINNIR